MKYCALFLIAASLASAADFVTGQAARTVVGQPTFTKQTPPPTDNTATQEFLGAASGIAYANGTLFVADSNRVSASPVNNRVLIYYDFPGKKYPPDATINEASRCPLCGGTPAVVLGQQSFTTTAYALTQNGMRQPTAIASDGQHLAVADTDNNRILIWNSIPSTNGQPADVVVGQPDFKTGTSNFGQGNTPSAKGLRGPQGVWFQGSKLMVADTQNHRVVIWNSIPTSNGTPADIVLGQASFTSFVQPDLTQTTVQAKPDNMLNPVSVTSDGQRLFVADLGHNRVLIWNSIPTSNAAPADIAIGQPSLTSTTDIPASVANNVKYMCPVKGQDPTTKQDLFAPRCAATLDFPRFALSDGQRLFIADGGNNRVLVFNSIPTSNGVNRADVILGQRDDETAEDVDPNRISAADTLRTPTSLAWDGTNLYVSDTFNRRIVTFNAANNVVESNGVRNAFSREIFSIASVDFAGSVKEADTATITIEGTDYKYTIVKDDTFATVIQKFTDMINGANSGAGDPNVFARANFVLNQIVLTAKKAGPEGEAVTIATSTSTGAVITLTTSGSQLSGSRDPAKIAPGTIISIFGQNLAADLVKAPADAAQLPTTLGGVQLFIDGVPAPLLMVSPTEVRAQLPFEVADSSSVSAYLRRTDPNGVGVTTAVGISVIGQNPGLLADEGTDPRPGIAYHYSSYGTGVVSVDGAIKANDTATITIEERPYTYTVQATDTLESVRNALINLINSNQDEKVTAYPGSLFWRVRLQSKIPGPEGEGIAYGASTNSGSSIVLSPYTTTICCSNTAGTRVTPDNPAVPGETIVFYATGLGAVQDMTVVKTGTPYNGPSVNAIVTPVDAIIGGKTANALHVGLAQGMVGVYEVQLQLNSDIPTNPVTQATIAQDIDISNVVTIPVNNPAPPQ